MDRRFVDEHRALEEQIEDLASSLHATTDVISEADRMLNHYRSINHTQEEEISRLQHASLDQNADGSYQQNGPMSSTPYDKQKKKNIKRNRHSRQRLGTTSNFTSSSDSEGFGGILSHLSETQKKLKHEIREDQRKRAVELERLHAALKRNESAATEDKLQYERNNKLNSLEQDVKALKDTVISAAIGSKTRQHQNSCSDDDNRSSKQTDKQTISALHNVVDDKAAENIRMFAEVNRLKHESKLAHEQQNQLVRTLQELRHQLQKEFEDRKLLEIKLETMELQKTDALSYHPHHDEIKKININLKNQNEYLYGELSTKKEELELQASDLLKSSKTIRKISDEQELEKRKWQSEKDSLVRQQESTLDELTVLRAALSEKENELTTQLVMTGETERKTTDVIKQYRHKYAQLQDSEKRLTNDNNQLQLDAKSLKRKLNDANKIKSNDAAMKSSNEALQRNNLRLKEEMNLLRDTNMEINQQLENMNKMLSEERLTSQKQIAKLEADITRIVSVDESSNHKSRLQFKEMEDLHIKECQEWEGQCEMLESDVNRLQEELDFCQMDLLKTRNSLERAAAFEVELRKTRKNTLLAKQANEESISMLCQQLDSLMKNKLLDRLNINQHHNNSRNKTEEGTNGSKSVLQDKINQISSYIKHLEDELARQSSISEQYQITKDSIVADVEASHLKLSKYEERNRELRDELCAVSMNLRHAELENSGMTKHLESCVKMMEQNCSPSLHKDLINHLSDVRDQHLYVMDMTGNCTEDRSQLEGLQTELDEASAMHNKTQVGRDTARLPTANLLTTGNLKDNAMGSLELTSKLILDIDDSVLVSRQRTSNQQECDITESPSKVSSEKSLSSHRPVSINELTVQRKQKRPYRYSLPTPLPSKMSN